MAEKEGNLDAVLKEAVDLVRNSLSTLYSLLRRRQNLASLCSLFRSFTRLVLLPVPRNSGMCSWFLGLQSLTSFLFSWRFL